MQRITAGQARGGAISGRLYLYLSVNTQYRWTWPRRTGSQSNRIKSVCTFYILRTALFPESSLLLASYFWASLTCNQWFGNPEGYWTHSFLSVPFTWQLTAAGVMWHLPWPGAMLQGHTPLLILFLSWPWLPNRQTPRTLHWLLLPQWSCSVRFSFWVVLFHSPGGLEAHLISDSQRLSRRTSS